MLRVRSSFWFFSEALRLSVNDWRPAISCWTVPAGPLKVIPGLPGWPSATLTPLSVTMWSTEKFSATFWCSLVRLVTSVSKCRLTGPDDTSSEAGLVGNPVGLDAASTPSKFGLPAASAGDAASENAKSPAPPSAATPPDFLSHVPMFMFIPFPP